MLNIATQVVCRLNAATQVVCRLNIATRVVCRLNVATPVVCRLNIATQVVCSFIIGTQVVCSLNIATQAVCRLNKGGGWSQIQGSRVDSPLPATSKEFYVLHLNLMEARDASLWGEPTSGVHPEPVL
jgi:hypothetical protein